MSCQLPRSSNRVRVVLSLACCGLAFLPLALVGGCAPTMKTGPTTRRSTAREADSMKAARDTLYDRPDLVSCRSAVGQLNVALAHDPSKKPTPLTAEERAFLAGADGYELDEPEMAEIASGAFTTLDAAYFDNCFLFRDAVRGLGLAEHPQRLNAQARASAAFDFVIRQVRLRERPDDPNPPQYILRRGWGTAYERALVFLAALQQAEVDGCLIMVPQQVNGKSHLRSGLVGALVGDDVLVFDTRLGMALPGPKGEGIATLAQLCSQPDVLGQLTVDSNFRYDITPQEIKNAELRVGCPLSALAPRMRFLQKELSGGNRVVLTMDGRAVLDRFKKAAAPLRLTVHVGNEPGDPGTPTRVLRSFLPPDEGGVDEPRVLPLAVLGGFVSLQNNLSTKIGRKRLFVVELIPWYFLPPVVRELEYSDNPGARLREMYAEFFASFPVPRASTAMVDKFNGGVAVEEDDPGRRLAFHFAGFQPGEQPVHFSLSSKTPRDNILRGRLPEAAEQLAATLDQVKYQTGLAAQPGLQDKLTKWCEQAWNLYAEVSRLQRQARTNTAGAMEALQQAQTSVSRLWMQTDGAPLPIWLTALAAAAAGPMENEASYLLALCKQEEAVRSQSADDWRSAADLWESYLADNLGTPPGSAARLMQAKALEVLGETDKARSTLLDMQGTMTDLEKVARQYRAKHLKPAAKPAPGDRP